MKEKVIPIMQLQDGECCEPMECQPVECDPCGPMSPMGSRVGTLMRGSLQPQRIRHAPNHAEDYLDEIIEEEPVSSNPEPTSYRVNSSESFQSLVIYQLSIIHFGL